MTINQIHGSPKDIYTSNKFVLRGGCYYQTFKCCLGAYENPWLWLNISKDICTPLNKFVFGVEGNFHTFKCYLKAYGHWWVSFSITKGYLHFLKTSLFWRGNVIVRSSNVVWELMNYKLVSYKYILTLLTSLFCVHK